jgi:glycosyl hydrolase family 113
MVTRAALLAASLGLAALAAPPRPEALDPAPGKGTPLGGAAPEQGSPLPAPAVQRQRGVALGMFAEDVSFSYGPLLAEIVALGATHVALVVPFYQTDGSSHDVALHTRFSPSLAAVAEAARAARRDGLEVMLFPIVRLASPKPGEWRGTLAPRDRDAWFRHYGSLLGELAAIAGLTGAKRLVVGSELSTLDASDEDLARWRPLLEKVRALFGGTLVYSANWDHYTSARLLELVDEAGISGYFNLRQPSEPATDAVLEAGWRRVRRELESWRVGRPQPFIFTELGYRSRAGASAAPWDEGAGGAPDLEEQRRAFAAFRRVWNGALTLDGLYIWNWYGFGGAGTTSYTPRGKPAEVEVRGILGNL